MAAIVLILPWHREMLGLWEKVEKEGPGMIFIDLLTDQQREAGLFAAQVEDFIYLFHRADDTLKIIAVFPYETATVRGIRDIAERAREKVENESALSQLKGKGRDFSSADMNSSSFSSISKSFGLLFTFHLPLLLLWL
ncbi:hypothetical protein ES703_33486 [subsurface metagenome]